MSSIWALNIPLWFAHFATSITSFGASDTRKNRVDICYTSLKDGEQSERIISPHTLVCTTLSWHVRAYLNRLVAYRDFVLSRIQGIPDINNNAIHGKRDDAL